MKRFRDTMLTAIKLLGYPNNIVLKKGFVEKAGLELTLQISVISTKK